MLWLILFGVLLVASGVYLYSVRPRVRRERLAGVRQVCTETRQAVLSVSKPPAQASLRSTMRETEALLQLATDVDARARGLPVPVPGRPVEGESAATTMARIAEAFSDPRVTLGVVAGEQVVATLFDVSGPETLGHLGAAAHALHLGDLLERASSLQDLGVNALQLAAGHVYGQMEQGVSLGHAALQMPEHVHVGLHDAHEHLAGAFTPEHAVGFHFPFVTLIVSSVKEGALLLDDKTSFERAALHVAVDTGATAAGGFGGAKLGAAIGTAVLPGLGTAIGGLLGGIGGAIGGRLVAQQAKAMPLKAAVAEYTATYAAMESATTDSARCAVLVVRESGERSRAEYLASLRPIAPSARASRHAEAIGGAVVRAFGEVEAYRTRLSDSRASFGPVARREIPAVSAFQWMMGLDVSSEAEVEIGLTQDLLDEQFAMLHRARPATNTWGSLQVLAGQHLPLHVDGALGCLAGALQCSNQDYAENLRAWADEAAAKYQRAVGAVSVSATQATNEHRAVFEAHRAQVVKVTQDVKRHQRALGMG